LTGVVEKRIEGFISKHHVMTLATVSADGGPWAAHVFYAWLSAENLFVFTTDTSTRHGTEMSADARIAAGIALETRTEGRVQGLQIEGQVRHVEGTELKSARAAYLQRFPYAALAPLSLWILEPRQMKLTDNTLGFGKKLIWTHNEL
jgi:uncharacterized protein YhbP (UPF0306 family)